MHCCHRRAEVGVNRRSSLDKARELVDVAVGADLDAVNACSVKIVIRCDGGCSKSAYRRGRAQAKLQR